MVRGVDGSSPSEASAKGPLTAGFCSQIHLQCVFRAVGMDPVMDPSDENSLTGSAHSPTRARAIATRCRSPWIVRRVGVHGRAAVIDGFEAQFVVPGFAAVDLA
jgi:hypothetical protein